MKDAEIIINDVVKGEYDLPRQFAPVIHEISDVTSKDAGKVLTVSKNGGPAWGEGGLSEIKWADIKDKPGGYDIKELVTVTDETATSGQLLTNHSAVLRFFDEHSGDTVVVTFDGTPYQCTIINDGAGSWHVGDHEFVEYPFCIVSFIQVDADPIEQAKLYTATTGESHTVKIEGYATTPVVFNKKYIPDLKTLTGSATHMEGRVLAVDESGVPKWTRLDSIIESVNGVSF